MELNRFFELLFYYYKRNDWLFWKCIYNKDSISIQKPIFLLGNQGDGLTFISRILRRNPLIISSTGNHNYWTGADEMATVFETWLPKTLRLSGRLTKTDPQHDKFSMPRSWSYGSDDLFSSYHLTEQNIKGQDVLKFKGVIKYILNRFGDKNSRFIDKSQVYTLKTRWIQEALFNSNPFFLLITRDPYVSCFRAASGKAGDLKRYSKFLSFDERFSIALQHWKNSMQVIDQDSYYLRNFYVYKFEHFVNNVEKSTKEICDYLELDFNVDMLPALNQKTPLGTKYKMRWYPIKKDVNSKYYKEINRRYFDWTENYLGDLAYKFGYKHPLK